MPQTHGFTTKNLAQLLLVNKNNSIGNESYDITEYFCRQKVKIKFIKISQQMYLHNKYSVYKNSLRLKLKYYFIIIIIIILLPEYDGVCMYTS